jgi:two-component system LytT family response regulator
MPALVSHDRSAEARKIPDPIPRLVTAEPETLRVLAAGHDGTPDGEFAGLLRAIRGVDLVAQCYSGRDVVRRARQLKPDVVLLDTDLPGVDGVTVAQRLAQADGPLVIFVAASENRALEALRLHAVDYLLKPIQRQRLFEAVEYARLLVRRIRAERVATEVPVGRVPSAVSHAPELTIPPRLSLRTGRHVHLVPLVDVTWLESFGNYTRVHATSGRYVHRATMAQMATELAPHRFVRIHRTAIVNATRVVRIRPGGNRQYEVSLDSGVRLTMGRTFRDALGVLFGRTP